MRDDMNTIATIDTRLDALLRAPGMFAETPLVLFALGEQLCSLRHELAGGDDPAWRKATRRALDPWWIKGSCAWPEVRRMNDAVEMVRALRLVCVVEDVK